MGEVIGAALAAGAAPPRPARAAHAAPGNSWERPNTLGALFWERSEFSAFCKNHSHQEFLRAFFLGLVIKRTETLEIPRVSEVRCDFLFWALGEDKPRLYSYMYTLRWHSHV